MNAKQGLFAPKAGAKGVGLWSSLQPAGSVQSTGGGSSREERLRKRLEERQNRLHSNHTPNASQNMSHHPTLAMNTENHDLNSRATHQGATFESAPPREQMGTAHLFQADSATLDHLNTKRNTGHGDEGPLQDKRKQAYEEKRRLFFEKQQQQNQPSQPPLPQQQKVPTSVSQIPRLDIDSPSRRGGSPLQSPMRTNGQYGQSHSVGTGGNLQNHFARSVGHDRRDTREEQSPLQSPQHQGQQQFSRYPQLRDPQTQKQDFAFGLEQQMMEKRQRDIQEQNHRVVSPQHNTTVSQQQIPRYPPPLDEQAQKLEYARALEQQMLEKRQREMEEQNHRAVSPQQNTTVSQQQLSRYPPPLDGQAQKLEYARALEQQMFEKRQREMEDENRRIRSPRNIAVVSQQHVPRYPPPPDEHTQKQEYARALEQQMLEKKQRELESRTNPAIVPTLQRFQPPQDERAQKLEYARALEQQMMEKRQREIRQGGGSPTGRRPLSPTPPSQYLGTAWQGNAFPGESEELKKRQYAIDLERQIQEKRERERRQGVPLGSGRDHYSPPRMNSHQPTPYLSPRMERIQKQQEYARQLGQQIALKKSHSPRVQGMYRQQQVPQIYNAHAPFSDPNRYPMDKVAREQQYARDLQEQIHFKHQLQQHQHSPQQHSPGFLPQPNMMGSANSAMMHGAFAQQAPFPPPAFHGPPMGMPMGAFHPGMSEKEEKRMKQLAYKQELEMQERMKNQRKAAERARERSIDQELLRQQAQAARLESGAAAVLPGSPTRHRQIGVPNSTGPGYSPQDMQISHVGYGGGWQGLQGGVQQGMFAGSDGMPKVGVEPISPPGATTPGGGANTFGRFRADLNDPMVRNELAEKKLKQMQRHQELDVQMQLVQERKKKEKEQQEALEREEEARIEKEQREIQEAFEREKAEQERKKQQQHQDELKKQIEEKRRQKELEKQRQKQEEEEEEARLRKEREQLEKRFRNNNSRNSQRETTVDSAALKASLFDPPSPSGEKLPGTAALFGGKESPVESLNKGEDLATGFGGRQRGKDSPKLVKSKTVPTAWPGSSRVPEDAIERLLRETEAAKSEQIKTRAALESLQAKLESAQLGAPSPLPVSFRRDVLCYRDDTEERPESHGAFLFSPSPFKNAAQRMLANRTNEVRAWGGPASSFNGVDSPLGFENRQGVRPREDGFRGTVVAESPMPPTRRERSKIIQGNGWNDKGETGSESPSIDLVKSLYASSPSTSDAEQLMVVPPGSKANSHKEGNEGEEERTWMQGSLKSDSKFIFPNGKVLDRNAFSASRQQMSKLERIRSEESLRGENDIENQLEIANQSNSPLMKTRVKTNKPKEQPVKQNVKPLHVETASRPTSAAAMSQVSDAPSEMTVKRELVLSPNFDIHRMHEANRRRLERLESIGDCSKLRGEQLDAFLEEFLQSSDQDSSVVRKEVEKSLECETRWISRRVG